MVGAHIGSICVVVAAFSVVAIETAVLVLGFISGVSNGVGHGLVSESTLRKRIIVSRELV